MAIFTILLQKKFGKKNNIIYPPIVKKDIIGL